MRQVPLCFLGAAMGSQRGRNSAVGFGGFLGRRMRSLIVYSREVYEAQNVKAKIIP